MNQSNDIEVLARQNPKTVGKDDNEDSDVVSQNQVPNAVSQVPMPLFPAPTSTTPTPQASPSPSQKCIAKKYTFYLVLIGAQFALVTTIVFSGLIYAIFKIH